MNALEKFPLMGGQEQMVTAYPGTVLWSCRHLARGHLLEPVQCAGHSRRHTQVHGGNVA